MTTQLAIGYLTTGPRNRGASLPGLPRSVHVTEHDSISTRPAIPQAVISWCADVQDALPVGAGDPAVDIEGPPPFQALVDKRAGRVARVGVDAVMLGGLCVLLLGLAGAVVEVGERATTAWAPSDPVALAANTSGKVPVVDVQIERLDVVPPPVPGRAKLATLVKPAAAN